MSWTGNRAMDTQYIHRALHSFVDVISRFGEERRNPDTFCHLIWLTAYRYNCDCEFSCSFVIIFIWRCYCRWTVICSYCMHALFGSVCQKLMHNWIMSLPRADFFSFLHINYYYVKCESVQSVTEFSINKIVGDRFSPLNETELYRRENCWLLHPIPIYGPFSLWIFV